VQGPQVRQEEGDFMLREPEVAYSARFDPEKGLLSLDNTIYFDINAEE